MPHASAPVIVGPRAADSRIHRASAPLLGTIVSIDVICPDDDVRERHAAVERAFGWFREVERTCSRFDPDSELMQLTRAIGRPVETGPLVFEAVRFALTVAHDTNGAFDPTMGLVMEARGHNREHHSGLTIHTPLEAHTASSYRDVELNETARTITLHAPMVLDLGAVAKGLAIDMAARELTPFRDFAVDAGGDLYLGGTNADGRPWRVGIRDPSATGETAATLHVSDRAVCTSGNYEPRHDGAPSPHILDPGDVAKTADLASTTVVAGSAMLADALATAAFVLGPDDGLALLERHGVDGLLITTDRRQVVTPGIRQDVDGR